MAAQNIGYNPATATATVPAVASTVQTAALFPGTGVPGWQIQSGGHISAVTADDGSGGMSLVGFDAPGSSGHAATIGAPTSVRTSSNMHTVPGPAIYALSQHTLIIVLIVSALALMVLTSVFTAVYFLRRSRRRRLQSFNRRTSELKRQSINLASSKPAGENITTKQ